MKMFFGRAKKTTIKPKVVTNQKRIAKEKLFPKN
jgi:hypothetical protein